MSAVKVTIELPYELVERAKTVGWEIDAQPQNLVTLIEDQLQKREAGIRLIAIAEQLQALPSELRLTEADIEAEIQAYRAEKAAKRKAHLA